MGSPEPNVCALGRLVGLGPLDVEKDRVAAPAYRSPPVVCTRLSNALTEGTVNSPSRRKPWKTTQRAAASIRRSGLSMLVSLRKAARIRLRMCLVKLARAASLAECVPSQRHVLPMAVTGCGGRGQGDHAPGATMRLQPGTHRWSAERGSGG